MKLARIHLRITGTVQGVGYRLVAEKKARSLELVGWVKNTIDGAVEVVAEGPQEVLETMRLWCREGPRNAVVTSVDVLTFAPISSLSFSTFEIRHSN